MSVPPVTPCVRRAFAVLVASALALGLLTACAMDHDVAAVRSSKEPGPGSEGDRTKKGDLPACSAEPLATILTTKQGLLYDADLERGKFKERGVPPCLQGANLITAMALDSRNDLWLIADGTLHRIARGDSDCSIEGKLEAQALAFVASEGGADSLYALRGSELLSVDLETLQPTPVSKIKASSLLGTADGRLLAFELFEQVLLVHEVNRKSFAVTTLGKAKAPDSHFAGAALMPTGLWLLFGDTPYAYDPLLDALVAAKPLAVDAGFYLLASSTCGQLRE